MADSQVVITPQVTEIQSTQDMKGTIRIGMRGIGNPTPVKWARATGAIRKLIIGLVIAVPTAPVNILSSNQSLTVVWWLGLASLLTYSLDYLIGVESPEKEKTN